MLYVTAPGTDTQLMTLVPSPPPPGTSVVGVRHGTSRASRTSTAGRNVRRLPFPVLFPVDLNNFLSIARPFTATSSRFNPADPWARRGRSAAAPASRPVQGCPAPRGRGLGRPPAYPDAGVRCRCPFCRWCAERPRSARWFDWAGERFFGPLRGWPPPPWPRTAVG